MFQFEAPLCTQLYDIDRNDLS